MLRNQIIPQLRAALPALRQDFAVQSIYLFGSIARGDDHPDSDVDVLVDFVPDSRPTLFTLVGIRMRLQGLLDRDVDVATPNGIKPRFRDAIHAEMLRVA